MVQVQRQLAEVEPTRADATSTPSTPQSVPERRLSRRADSEQPQFADTVTPTTRSDLAQPSRAPRASLAVGRQPTVSRQTTSCWP